MEKFTSMASAFEDLPDNDEDAFLHLEQEFRASFEACIESQNSNYAYCSADYMNKTLAAAKALGIEALGKYEVISPNARGFSESFGLFVRDVDNIIVQIRVLKSRRTKATSVGLSSEQKTKIHAFVGKIRIEIENSSASLEKKEKLFRILAVLSVEIDKPRTGLERFGDLARGLAGVSKEIADGAEPWWKWFRAAMGVVDDAKEAEPQLPKPPEVKRIEPPRRELPKPGRDFDDEIPF